MKGSPRPMSTILTRGKGRSFRDDDLMRHIELRTMYSGKTCLVMRKSSVFVVPETVGTFDDWSSALEAGRRIIESDDPHFEMLRVKTAYTTSSDASSDSDEEESKQPRKRGANRKGRSSQAEKKRRVQALEDQLLVIEEEGLRMEADALDIRVLMKGRQANILRKKIAEILRNP